MAMAAAAAFARSFIGRAGAAPGTSSGSERSTGSDTCRCGRSDVFRHIGATVVIIADGIMTSALVVCAAKMLGGLGCEASNRRSCRRTHLAAATARRTVTAAQRHVAAAGE
jgi:transketolase C-terminal domain/subunit